MELRRSGRQWNDADPMSPYNPSIAKQIIQTFIYLSKYTYLNEKFRYYDVFTVSYFISILYLYTESKSRV